MAVQPGWFERQSKSISEEVAAWPAYLRRAAGLEGPRMTREVQLFLMAVDLAEAYERSNPDVGMGPRRHQLAEDINRKMDHPFTDEEVKSMLETPK